METSEQCILNKNLEKADNELLDIARTSEPSVLRERLYEGLSEETWMAEVLKELSTRCPVVSEILNKLLDANYLPEKKIPAMRLIYSIIAFLTCPQLSRVQRINTVLCIKGQASTNVS